MTIANILDDTVATWREERPDLDFDSMALFLKMSAIVQSVIDDFRTDLGELGITVSEFDVLATLRRSGSRAVLTPSHIAHVAMVKPSGLAHRLAQLEQRGLISRTPDPADR
ncbi:MAG: MarR family winged helix-turn-helix transcriptional regulator, partial [Actinomycetota bacterium]